MLLSLAVYGLLRIVYLSLIELISNQLYVALSSFERALKLNNHDMLITRP